MTDSNLVPHKPANPPAVAMPTSFTQHGSYNLQAGSVGVVNNIYVNAASPKPIVLPSNTSAECFHLLVGPVDCEQSQGALTIQKDRALSTGSTVPQLVDRFRKLTPAVIEELRTFPAVIAAENKHYGRAGDTQLARIGFVTDIRLRQAGISIEYFAVDHVPQEALNDLHEELDLWGNSRFNELNQTHWALKNVDLFGVLNRANVPLEGSMSTLWKGQP